MITPLTENQANNNSCATINLRQQAAVRCWNYQTRILKQPFGKSSAIKYTFSQRNGKVGNLSKKKKKLEVTESQYSKHTLIHDF